MITKKYSEYKDSQIEWIGKIPKHWNTYKLKHVINEFIAGGTPKSSNDAFWDENNKGIPWVAIGDMTDNDYINSTTKSLTREGFASKNLRILKKGTLIYSIFASLGKTSFLNIDATTNQAILGLITSNRIDDYYLKYYLEALKLLISSFSNENTQENLNSTIVKNMEIAMPNNLEEQQQIAKYLDKKTAKIDATIAKNEELIELLEEKRITLINQVVTKGLNPDALMKYSGIEWIGEIPEHYTIIKLKFLTSKIGSGKTPKGGSEIYVSEGIPLLRSQNIHFDSIRFDDVVYITDKINQGMLSTVVKNQDILLNITGASIGRCNYIENIDIANVNQHVCIIRPNKKIFYKYLNYFLQSECGQNQVFLNQNGTSREGLNFEDLSNFYIILPNNIDEQKRIVSFLEEEINRLYGTINKVKETINLLEEYKTSLIHHVVTGKIDVRGEEI